MQKLWCWRCKMEVTMLDDEEYFRAVEIYRRNLDILDKPTQEKEKELLDYYNNLTGGNETDPNVIMHHRIAQYGPPCKKCGKPYRTPLASSCESCGNIRFDKSN